MAVSKGVGVSLGVAVGVCVAVNVGGTGVDVAVGGSSVEVGCIVAVTTMTTGVGAILQVIINSTTIVRPIN